MSLKNLSLNKKLILTFLGIMASCFLATAVVFVEAYRAKIASISPTAPWNPCSNRL